MKRPLIAVLLAALFAAAFWWFSRSKPAAPAPVTAPAAATPAPPLVEDPKRIERDALFGAEALGADVTWRQNGLGYKILDAGTPPKPGIGATVRLNYVGRLKDGTVFDRSGEKPTDFVIGTTIPGLSVGLQLLGTGGKGVFFIPPALGYGNRKVAGIPPGSGLIFEIEILAVNP